MRVVAQIVVGFILTLALSVNAHARSVTFEAVCIIPTDCQGDEDFGMTFTFREGVVEPGSTYNASADGGANLVSWTISSSVGDGFSGGGRGINGIDGVNGDLLFVFNDAGVLEAVRDSAGQNVFGFNIQPGGIGFFNWRNADDDFGPGTTVINREDFQIGGEPAEVNDSDDITVAFRLVTPFSVPSNLSAPLMVILLLMAVVPVARRRQLL
ncbi:MAG: hypothetical protein AAGH19_09655 [Pseudomonadota bacterium]